MPHANATTGDCPWKASAADTIAPAEKTEPTDRSSPPPIIRIATKQATIAVNDASWMRLIHTCPFANDDVCVSPYKTNSPIVSATARDGLSAMRRTAVRRVSPAATPGCVGGLDGVVEISDALKTASLRRRRLP